MDKCGGCRKYHCPVCGSAMEELTCSVCGSNWGGDEEIEIIPIDITPDMYA